MSLHDALNLHSDICETMHNIMLKENRHLKATGTPPDDAFLHAKRLTLAELGASLAMLRAQASTRSTPEIRAAATKAQQTILKALLVDRENEQLLLKSAVAPRMPRTTAARPPSAHFKRAYSNAP